MHQWSTFHPAGDTTGRRYQPEDLALAGFEALLGFVDYKQATLAANQAVIAMACA